MSCKGDYGVILTSSYKGNANYSLSPFNTIHFTCLPDWCKKIVSKNCAFGCSVYYNAVVLAAMYVLAFTDTLNLLIVSLKNRNKLSVISPLDAVEVCLQYLCPSPLSPSNGDAKGLPPQDKILPTP